ncbi:hypothetical protein [Paraburkholderia sp. HD33-4]|uniref:hypothetical protein n=1 Tax=Paraburkholderia sp. HD33-4 TaxID=2883242 RepID=UPI001F335578|nr:hypothetical protein [Paraburkholderia sp. HD33-4]
MTTAYHRDFDRLCALLKERGPIAFSMRLAQITGHPKDAVLLSQLVYWTRHGRDVVGRQGWIHKTREQWFEETGLSREEQENVRRRLRRLNLAQEWRGGRPARLYFRIHAGTLSAALSHAHRLEQPVHLSLDFMRSNEHAMRALFGPSVAFHRVLAEVTGSVNAALMLSRMIQLQRHTLDTDGQWFSLTASEWERDCGLKRRQFENAKQKLRQLGLIEEFVSHERHRRVFSRVHPVRLLELLWPIVQRISVEVDGTPSVSGRGRTASPSNGAAFVKTLDTGIDAPSPRRCTRSQTSVKTLDTRNDALPPGRRTSSDVAVKTLDRRYGVRTFTSEDNVHDPVRTMDTWCSSRLSSGRAEHYGAVKTLDTQYWRPPSPARGASHSTAGALGRLNNTWRPPGYDDGRDAVKMLDTRHCTLPSPAHAESRDDPVQTLDRRCGVRPSPAREADRDSVKTLDTQSRGRSIPVHDRITAPKSLTNFSQAEKLDGEKRTLQSAGFVHGSRRETYIANARAYTTTSTNTPTTTGGPGGTTTAVPLVSDDLAGEAKPAVVVGQEKNALSERRRSRQPDDRSRSANPDNAFESASLVWPSCVHAAERQPIAQHLARVPHEDRQIMLDEMAASHRQHPVKWPVAYVGRLVKRYQAGDFIPAKAHIEREHRRLAAVRQLALREHEEQFASQLPPASSPETARHNLAVLRDALRHQWGKSGGKRD